MATQTHTPKKDQNDWAPSLWDLYGNASQVLDGLKRKADVRVSFSPHELAGDAGRFILDQYHAAKGETSLGTVTQAAFSLNNLKLFLAKILPLAGFVAAIGIDYAVFGAASKDMDSNHMPFGLNPFAVGSLVFAAGLGLAMRSKSTFTIISLYGTMILATLGASFISADSSALRDHFTKSIASFATRGSDDEEAKVSSLTSEVENTKNLIEKNENELSTGGNNGSGLLADGSTGNDELARKYIAENDSLKKVLAEKERELNNAKPLFEQAKRKDWTDLVGRILAAIYVSSWLIAAQLMVSGVISSAARTYRKGRKKIVGRSEQNKFVSDLENPDEEIRQLAIRAAVVVTLSRFSEILSTSKNESKHVGKHDNFANVFEKESYNIMVAVTSDIVAGGIIPRKPSLMKRIASLLANSREKRIRSEIDSISSDILQRQGDSNSVLTH